MSIYRSIVVFSLVIVVFSLTIIVFQLSAWWLCFHWLLLCFNYPSAWSLCVDWWLLCLVGDNSTSGRMNWTRKRQRDMTSCSSHDNQPQAVTNKVKRTLLVSSSGSESKLANLRSLAQELHNGRSSWTVEKLLTTNWSRLLRRPDIMSSILHCTYISLHASSMTQAGHAPARRPCSKLNSVQRQSQVMDSGPHHGHLILNFADNVSETVLPLEPYFAATP